MAFPEIHAVSDYPLILGAHRGNSVNYTENTMEAFEDAIADDRYKFIEFDIQYTKDKEIVVIHDITLARLQKRAGRVPDLSYEELNEEGNFYVPLYDEVMDLIGKTKKINVEIKSQGNFEDDKRMVDFVVRDCKKRGVLEDVAISSISKDVVKYVSLNYPSIKTGIIFWIHPVSYIKSEKLVEGFYEDIKQMGADYVMFHGVNLKNYDLLVELKPKDVQLSFWYFTDEMYILQKDETDGLW
jgi:glycerophosphoryl diester phosphodiesterase